MKPCLLKLKGINSFIEEQTIDFCKLTERGLFGIFGPTGSGKSTILDAITLALYGEIPRSGKDLSGMVNSQGDKASIYYEFEIGSKSDRRRYFVSRAFKRDKEGSVRTNGVKLCDVTHQEEPIVLEEKVTTVNHKIQEIIGLKCEDFTRSVVLPQGNFSDFLKLSGTHKRDMLERIFALQEYGGHLSSKIKGYKKKVEERYTLVQGALNAYEGISQEGYDALQKEMKDLQGQYENIKKQWEQTQREYEHSKKLWELTQEYQDYLCREKELQKQAGQIEKYKMQYELAERAKNIQPYIDQQHQLLEELKKKEEAHKVNEKNLHRIVKQLKNIENNWEIQQKKKENSIPKLSAQKEKLTIALEKQRKSQQLQKQYHAIQRQEQRIQRQFDQNKEILEDIKKQLEKITEKQREDQSKAEKLQIPSQYRTGLYQAYDLEKRYKDTYREEEDLTKKIQRAKDHKLKPMLQQREKLEEQIKQLEQRLQTSTKNYETIESTLKELEHQNLAAILAKDLQRGEGCPVCGSKEHPVKANFIQEEEIKTLQHSKEEMEKSLEDQKTQLEKKRNSYQEASNEISLGQGFVQQWQQEQKEYRKRLETLEVEYEKAKKELKVENVEESLQILQQQERILEQLQKNINIRQRKMQEQEGQKNTYQEKHTQYASELIKYHQSKEALKDQIQEVQVEIERYCGKKDPQREIQKIDQEIKTIHQEYEKIKADFEKYTQEKIRIEKEKQGIEDTLQHLYGSREQKERILNKMLDENGFTNTQEVIACFKDTKQRQELKNTIKEYEERLHSVQENIQRLQRNMKGQSIDKKQWDNIQEKLAVESKKLEEINKSLIEKNTLREDMRIKLKGLKKALEEEKAIEHQRALLKDLEGLFQGNVFVEFISMGQLRYIAREASQQLKKITRGRYALELDNKGNFIMRDDFNGGVRRGTQTLSGGETFLTSLSLALALSSHIQLKGKAPLEFFFLDEGFGTLDHELLEVVMGSLEKLHSDRLSVGLISHVEELKQRIPRKLIVTPAMAGVSGTKITLEKG